MVHGGDTRQQSVSNALAQVDPTTEIVVVHDAVRPFVSLEQIDRVIAEARKRGAAILGIPAIDTVKEVKRASLPEDMALITATVPRERIVLAQTPQAFQYALIRDAFRDGQKDGVTASDESGLVERFGHDVYGRCLVLEYANLKIARAGRRIWSWRGFISNRSALENDSLGHRVRSASARRGAEADDWRRRGAV